MMFVPTKGGEVRNVIMYNTIWADYVVYRWLGANALFDETFASASGVILSVLVIG